MSWKKRDWQLIQSNLIDGSSCWTLKQALFLSLWGQEIIFTCPSESHHGCSSSPEGPKVTNGSN